MSEKTGLCAGAARYPSPDEAGRQPAPASMTWQSRHLRAPRLGLEARRGQALPVYPLDMESGRLESEGRFEKYAQDALDSLPLDLL